MNFRYSTILIAFLGIVFSNPDRAHFLDLSYTIDCSVDRIDDDYSMHGKNTVTVTNRWVEPIGELYFQLIPNSNDHENGLIIESVQATRQIKVSGKETSSLRLGLFPALKPGEQMIIDIQFKTPISALADSDHPLVYKDNDKVVILAQHFYPAMECFHEDGWQVEHHGASFGHPKSVGDYTISITVPEELTVVSSVPDDGVEQVPIRRRRYEYKATDLIDFVFVASTEKGVVNTEIAGSSIIYYTNSTSDTSLPNSLYSMVESVLPIYQEWMGDLPKRRMVFVGFPNLPTRVLSWGNMIVYHPELLDGHTLGHELARQWLGFYAYAADPNEVWLNESLAEYFVWLYEQRLIEENKAPRQDQTNVFQQLFYNYRSLTSDEWMRLVLDVMGDRVDYPKFQSGKNTRWENSSHLYSQYIVGSHALQLLQHTVHETTMLKIIRTYLHRFAHRPATTEEFIGIVSELCGEETAQNFRLALTTNIRPDIQIRKVTTEEFSPHQWETRVDTKYQGDWVLPVNAIAITEAGDSLSQKQLKLNKNDHIIFYSSDPIKTILLDPENKLYDANRFNNRWPRRLIFRPLIGRPTWDVYSISYRPRFFKDWLHNWRLGARISGGLGLNLMPIMPALFQNSFDLDITFSTGMPEKNWGGRFSYRTPLSSIHLTYWDFTIDYAYPRNQQTLSLINYLGEPSYYLTSGKSLYNRLVTQVRRVEYTDTLSTGWWDRGIQYWFSEEYKRFYYSGDRRYVLQAFGLIGHALEEEKAFNLSRLTLAADGEQHLWNWLIARGHLEFGFTWDTRSEDVLRYRLQYLPKIWKERENFVPLYRGFVANPDSWWNTVAGSGFSFGYETDWFAWPMLYVDMAFVSPEVGSVIDRVKALSFSSNAFTAVGLGVESQSMIELGVYFPFWLSSPPNGEPNWYPRVIFQWGFYF